MHPAGVQAGDRVSAGCGTFAAPRGVDPAWLDDLVNIGASSSVRSSAVPPVKMVSFSESVDRAEDDNVCMNSEKPPPQEGLIAVLRLLYQLCSSAASAPPVRPQRSCDFEGLLAPESLAHVEEPSPVLYHRLVELWTQAQALSQSVAEAGKLPSAALPSHKRSVASCAEERLCAPLLLTQIYQEWWVIYRPGVL